MPNELALAEAQAKQARIEEARRLLTLIVREALAMAKQEEQQQQQQQHGGMVSTGVPVPQIFSVQTQGPPPPKWHERLRGVLVWLLILFVSALLLVVSVSVLLRLPAAPEPPKRPEMRPTRECMARLDAVEARVNALQLKCQARGLNVLTTCPFDRRLAAEYRAELTTALDREEPISKETLHLIRRDLAQYEYQLDLADARIR